MYIILEKFYYSDNEFVWRLASDKIFICYKPASDEKDKLQLEDCDKTYLIKSMKEVINVN